VSFKLIAEPDMCQGHGRCYALAPDLFGLDGSGFVLIADREFAEEDRELAELACANCPEGAIRVE
jgi:ferredoxin